MVNSNDYFSSGVSCFKIADGFGNPAKWVASVDNRRDFAGFQEIFHKT